MKKRLTAAVLAAGIECHWWFIMRLRRIGKRWLSGGEPLSSRRLQRLSRRLDYHGLKVRQFSRYFETHCLSAPEKCTGAFDAQRVIS